jgi:hypothetical protein
MTVGIPGVGFGGIFYLCSALLMPFRELAQALRRDERPLRWGLVARQSSMAAGILVAMWATGWALGRMLAPHVAIHGGAGLVRGSVPHNAFRVSALGLSLGVLALLVFATRVAHLVLASRGGIPEQQLTPMAAARGPLPEEQRADHLDTGTGGRRYDSGSFPRRR